MIKDRNFIWNAIGTTLNSFLSLFLLIIVTRINGIEMSGMFSFIFTLTLILYTVSNYGGRVYQVSDIKDEFSFNEYLTSRIVSSIIAMFIMIILCIIYGYKGEIMLVAISLMALRVIETFSDVFYAIFQKENRLDKAGISLTCKSVLILILFFIINYFTKNIGYASIGIVIASLLIFAFYDLKNLKKFEQIKFSFNINVFKKSIYIFLFSFVTLYILNAPRFVANYTLTKDELGYLGILLMIPTVMLLACQFILQPQFVNLTTYYNKKNNDFFKKTIKKINISILIFSIICIICAFALGPIVLNILYGIQFGMYRLDLCILIIAGTFNGLSGVYSNGLIIMRKTKIQFYIYLIILLVSIIISYFLSSVLGLNGIFYSLLITFFVQYVLFYILFKYYYKKTVS